MMNWSTFPYYLPYIGALLISLVIAGFAWRRRLVPGADAVILYVLVEALWTVGYIFELDSESLGAKVFWDDIQFVGMFGVPSLFLLFAMYYTGDPRAGSQRLRAGLAGIALVGMVLVFTDPYHHLIRSDTWLEPGEPFSALRYDFTVTVWIISIYVYSLTFYGFYLLIRRFVHQPIFRSQVAIILFGFSFPLIGGLLTLFDVTLTHQRDTTPLTLAIGNLFVAWGLFRLRLFDLTPAVHHVVLETMHDIVIVLDAENRVVELNAAAQELLDLQKLTVIGQPVEIAFAAWPEVIERFRFVDQFDAEITVPGIDDTSFHFDLRISKLHNSYGQLTGRLIMLHDITALKQTEQELAQHRDSLAFALNELTVANERLQALGHVKDEFVSNVSHELRTPISNLKLHLDLINLKPEKRAKYLTTMQHETVRLENLIEGLLTLSRLDQGRIAFEPCDGMDLNELCRKYVNDRIPLAQVKRLQLRFEPGLDVPSIPGDGNLLGQVLSIFITNALHYTEPGGSVIVATDTRATNGTGWAGFSVRDTGPGIPQDEQDQLFTRFFRGEIGRESGVPGTGLGLAIAKKIVDQHRGCIEVVSTGIPGEGAMFILWLPIQMPGHANP